MTANGTILVIEDDFDIADTLKDVLGDAGYAVEWVDGGERALDYLRTHPRPGLILLDLMMPGMDGFGFRREQLREPRLASIPVVVMTASRGLERVQDLAFSGWIKKPVNLDELLDVVRGFCLPDHGMAREQGRGGVVPGVGSS